MKCTWHIRICCIIGMSPGSIQARAREVHTANRDLQNEPAHYVLDAVKLLQGAPSEHPDLGTVKD